MGIIVKFFATFRALVGRNPIEVPAQEPMILRQVLDFLFEKHGEELRDLILKDGKIRERIQILVNGRSVKWLAELDTPTREGDIIAIFPPVGGG